MDATRPILAAIDFAEAGRRAAVEPSEEVFEEVLRAAREVVAALGGSCPREVARALVVEAELAAPHLAFQVGALAALPFEEMRPSVARQVMESMSRGGVSPREAALVAAHLAGGAAFGGEAGAGYVYEGFAWLRAGQPRRAEEAFAAARAAGGDPAEVRRGEQLSVDAARAEDPRVEALPSIDPPAPPPLPAWARPGATALALLRMEGPRTAPAPLEPLRERSGGPPSAGASGSAPPSAQARGRGSRPGDRRSSGSPPDRS